MLTAAVVAVLLSALGAAVAGAGSGEQIVVTRESTSLPGGCAPRDVAQLLVSFARAMSDGDATTLDRLLAVEDPPGRAVEPAGLAFRWFSVTEGRAGATSPWRHVAFYDRADALAYFAERHAEGEHWELVGVAVSRSWTGGAGIQFAIRRAADDLPDWLGPVAHGKGGIDCSAGRIYLWSMGQNDTSIAVGPPCPKPSGWSPGEAIVACALGPNARAIAESFRLEAGVGVLPRPCAPPATYRRLRSTLAAFDAGLGDEFARRFMRTPLLLHRGARLSTRAQLARFARSRYSAGEGWTATALRAPARALSSREGARARYRLALRISRPLMPPTATTARVSVDCRTGLIEAWVPARGARS